MAEAGESQPFEDVAAREAVPLDDIEQDLNNVEAALAALDSGDLDAAEALAAVLDSSDARAPDESMSGDEQEPASPAC